MTANELADWIEKSPYSEYHTAIEAAFMLRQQQAEIEALKAAVDLEKKYQKRNVELQAKIKKLKEYEYMYKDLCK